MTMLRYFWIAGCVLAGPSRAALDLLVTDQAGGTIHRYHGDTGAYLGTFITGLVNPLGVECGPDGFIYVADDGSQSGMGSLKKYSADGTFVFDLTVGTQSPTWAPKASWADGRSLWIMLGTAVEHRRYDVWTGELLDAFSSDPGVRDHHPNPSGDELWTIGQLGSGAGELRKYTVDGALISQHPLAGPSGSAWYSQAVKNNGDILINNGNRTYVQRYSSNVTFLENWVNNKAAGVYGRLKFGPDGYLYAYRESNILSRYDGSTGAYVDDFVVAAFDMWDHTWLRPALPAPVPPSPSFSIPEIDKTTDISGTFLEWESEAGATYFVEVCTNLAEGGFDLIDNAIPGKPPVSTYTDTRPEATGAFYRVGRDLSRTVAYWPVTLDLGSHRAKVHVSAPADAARARIPWRRRDLSPESKAVIVVDAQSGERITDVLVAANTAEYGDIVFQALNGPGDYYVYYLPHPAALAPMDTASYTYQSPQSTANPDWLDRNGFTPPPGQLVLDVPLGGYAFGAIAFSDAEPEVARVQLSDGSVVAVATNGTVSPFIAPTRAPTAFTAGGVIFTNGHYYVADRATSSLKKYNITGVFVTTVATGLGDTYDTILASDGFIYVSTGGNGAYNDYQQVDIALGKTGTVRSPASIYGGGVRQSAIDNQGRFWITIPGLNTIKVYDFGAGAEVASYDDTVMPGSPADALDRITVRRSDGHIFAWQENAKRLLELDPGAPAGSTVLLNQYDMSGATWLGFNSVSMGPDGNLYVTDSDSGSGSVSGLKVFQFTAASITEEQLDLLPQAAMVALQARTGFDRVPPMEIPATAEETSTFLAGFPALDYLVFPEDRANPVRMFEGLPLSWVELGPRAQFSGQAQPGEYYTFQLGVWAARAQIGDVNVSFSDLAPVGGGDAIQAAQMTCFNTEGTDWLGRPLTKVFQIPLGGVRALWIGVPIPQDASGTYLGQVTVQPTPGVSTVVPVRLDVSGPVLADQGDGEPWRHSRLRWLNSTRGLEDTVIPPFTPLAVTGSTDTLLNREVTFGINGLPQSIRSNGREILAASVTLLVQTSGGPVLWTRDPTRLLTTNEAVVVRETDSDSAQLSLTTRSKTEFDGCVTFEATFEAKTAVEVTDIRLQVPLRQDVARYMMGFNREGGARPAFWQYNWDEDWAHNKVWLGDADAGLQVKLITQPDVWQFWTLRDTGIPESWGNSGNGGATISEAGNQVRLHAYSGPRSMTAGQQLTFHFRFLITPFKPIDNEHWDWREASVAQGGNRVQYHHATTGNGYINYPFLEVDYLINRVAADKAAGQEKVLLYYTVRELSNHAVELWALRSLGDEIFATDDAPIYEVTGDYEDSGGYPWLQEHLLSGYVPQWMMPLGDVSGGNVDAAIATTGLSRWHNYYIEGLHWLITNTDIDGLYLDGIGYDREIMKRVARVVHQLKPQNLHINHHSGNTRAGNPISAMNGYMELLPYISDLHYGEAFDYDKPPDYWLVEMSGIPFGLVNEIRGTPHPENPYRAMLYGGFGRFDASRYSLWTYYDLSGIKNMELFGYWDPDCPVQTGHPNVLATAYREPTSYPAFNKALIALASWDPSSANVQLQYDWPALGIEPATATLTASSIGNFQNAASFAPTDPIPVDPGGGWLLTLSGPAPTP